MSDAPATPHKLPPWVLLVGVTVLAVGTRILIAFVERGEVFRRTTELTAVSIAATAFAAVIGTYVGRRWINRLSGLLLGVVFAGIAALLMAGSSNIIPGLSVGLLVSGVALFLRNPTRLAIAAGSGFAAAACIAFAAPGESPLIWGCLAGAFVFLLYGYRLPRREQRAWKTWLALASRTAAVVLIAVLAAWWGRLAPIRETIAKIQASGNSIGFHSMPKGPLRSFRKELEASGIVPVKSVGLTLTKPDSQFVVGLSRFPSLEYLELTDTTLDERSLAGLARAPALQMLQFTRCQVAEEAWDALARSSSLNSLFLNHTEISVTGVATLAKTPSLATLSLDHSGADAEAFKAFAAHPGLSALQLSGPPVNAEFLRTLDHLPFVTVLSLSNQSTAGLVTAPTPALPPLRETDISPELAAVQKASNLKVLNLSVPLDEELRRGLIRETPNLWVLETSRHGQFHPDAADLEGAVVQADLSYSGEVTQLSDALQQMPALRCVDVSGCRLNVGDLAMLATLPKLEMLVLDRAKLLPEELKDLASAALLSTVSIRKVSVPGWSLAFQIAQFSQWPALRELDLAYNGIVDADLTNLGVLPNLTALNLKGNPITDTALAHLAGMAALERLDLRETQITAGGVKSLQQRLPKLEIRWDEK